MSTERSDLRTSLFLDAWVDTTYTCTNISHCSDKACRKSRNQLWDARMEHAKLICMCVKPYNQEAIFVLALTCLLIPQDLMRGTCFSYELHEASSVVDFPWNLICQRVLLWCHQDFHAVRRQ